MPKVTVEELASGDHPSYVRLDVDLDGHNFEITVSESFGSNSECEIDVYTKDEYVLNTRSGKNPKNVKMLKSQPIAFMNEDETIGVSLWGNGKISVTFRQDNDDIWSPPIMMTKEVQD